MGSDGGQKINAKLTQDLQRQLEKRGDNKYKAGEEAEGRATEKQKKQKRKCVNVMPMFHADRDGFLHQ